MNKLKVERSYFDKMRFSFTRGRSIMLLLLLVIVYSSCQKPKLEETKPKDDLKTMNGSAELQIDLNEVVAKLPQTILYNLGSNAHLSLDRAQWHYNDAGVTVRIPTTDGPNSYIYVAKLYNNPGATNVYAVRFFPDAGSTGSTFSGKLMWLDLQDWHTYGITYAADVAVDFMVPLKQASPGWETCMLDNNHFFIDTGGSINVHDEEAPGSSL